MDKDYLSDVVLPFTAAASLACVVIMCVTFYKVAELAATTKLQLQAIEMARPEPGLEKLRKE